MLSNTTLLHIVKSERGSLVLAPFSNFKFQRFYTHASCVGCGEPVLGLPEPPTMQWIFKMSEWGPIQAAMDQRYGSPCFSQGSDLGIVRIHGTLHRFVLTLITGMMKRRGECPMQGHWDDLANSRDADKMSSRRALGLRLAGTK